MALLDSGDESLLSVATQLAGYDVARWSGDPIADLPAHIDVALIDESLIDSNQGGLFSTLMERSPRPVVVGVFRSGEGAALAARRMMSAGVDDFIALPAELDWLPERIQRISRSRSTTGTPTREPSQSEGRYQELIEAAQRQAVELRLLHGVRSALGTDFGLDVIFERIVEQVAAAFGYTHVSLYLLENRKELLLQHQIGYDNVLERIPITRGVAGRVVRSEEPVLVSNIREDPDFLAAVDDIASEVCVPFFRRGEIAGILNVESTGEMRLGLADLRLMIEVSGFLSLALERVELQAAAVASEQRLRIALDAAGMGTWYWNPSSGELQWSEQIGPLYGLPVGAATLDSEAWLTLIHPDDREHVRRVDRQFLQFGDDYEIEYRVMLPSGAIRWLTGKGRVLKRGSRGEPTRVVGITMDVTGRKRLEEERLRLVQVEAARVEAEDAQRRLTDTLERMTAGFVAVDQAWRFTFLNGRATDLLRKSADTLLGQVIWDEFTPLLGEGFEARLHRIAESQHPEIFVVHAALINAWLEVHAYPSPGGLSVYLYDVTQRRQADRERRNIEDRFRSLVQNASDIILILGRDGTVLYASPAIERVIGHRPDEVVGSDNFFRVHPADAKRLRLAFVRVAKASGVSQPIVLRFQHRNGTYRWLEVTATNLVDDPTINGIIANCRDVTERHEAEFNLWFLAETSAMLGTSLDLDATLNSLSRLVVSHLADLCVVDIVDENDIVERVVVAHRDQALERRLAFFRERFPLDPNAKRGPGHTLRTGRSMLYESIDDDMHRVLSTDAGQAAEYRALGFRSGIAVPLVARGTTIGVLSLASATPGRFSHTDLGLAEELARRAALAVDNARLYHASRAAVEARDQFLSVAAHELRTPITAITGFATLLEREVANRNDPARVERFIRRLTDAGGRLALLVDDMLDVSRIRLGQLPLRINEIDLGSLLNRVVQGITEQNLYERHALVVTMPDEPCIVPADEDRLEQVLANLIDNALKYSPDGGSVEVELCPAEGGYEISVRDTGIGLPANELDSIFNPFGRAQNALRSNLPGLGIGLYISRNIVERHGGRIWAESAGELLGTAVTLWLPIEPAADPVISFEI